MATAPATLERKRNELGFKQVGMAKGIPIYVSTEGAYASESENRAVEAKLGLAMHQLLLSCLSSDSSFRDKFNENGRSDTNFWIAGTGRDINYLVTDSQEAEITESQVANILKLAESGMMYTDIAQKLDIPAAGVYYALKKGSKRKNSLTSLNNRLASDCPFFSLKCGVQCRRKSLQVGIEHVVVEDLAGPFEALLGLTQHFAVRHAERFSRPPFPTLNRAC